ncbi:glycosyl hydrolase family 88 [Paenibacillus marchantiophytorum]|uniref:Glycosyl hydrolase family 88 n=1 Tax=Paenibacillus marchantiophytorum TaxID=1619310 RepID=A0ABQ1FFY8_9BACL|nr:glycoside hydrolase family 88 protein [Paenibacillus marchantiophytorum]GGA08861.1 glycosyl hydrolase family 88 [Paenibacillus marchantiophytorum]
MELDILNLWPQLQRKVDTMIEQIGSKSPHVEKEGVYDDARLDWWTSGFWPGLLWIMYDVSQEDKYRQQAWDWDGKIEACFLRENNFHHDVGFQFLPTAVAKYKMTGDQDGRRRGLHAANFLAGRFNQAGQFLRAWNQDKHGWAIIDSSLNLSLLLWAAEELGDPRLKQIAMAHADTVLEHFIRDDGSVCHIVSFNPDTGAFIEALGGQGFSPTSAWSRGQSWALHGLANVYRYTGESRYLAAAKRVAHYFMANTTVDPIPLWDFRTGDADLKLKDTSAAACAASGLLEIASLVPAEEADLYRNQAIRIMDALTQDYADLDGSRESILREGTGHKPAGQNVNVGLIYGDYYYIEAAAKLKNWTQRIF